MKPFALAVRGVAVAAFVLSACGGPPVVVKEATVIAEFDPAAVVPLVPKPNDMAIDRVTGLIDLEDAADASPVEKELNAYLRTLDGFPISSEATTVFSAPINEATITAKSVRVFDVTNAASVTEQTASAKVTYQADKKQLSIKAPWAKAHRYALVLVGGAEGLKGANGEPVVASAAFEVARVPYPLVTCSDLNSMDCRSANPAIRGKTIEDERDKAVKMEQLRLNLQPALGFLENAGVLRANVAGAWVFSTGTMPLVQFDPGAEIVPFPNDVLMKDGLVDLPIEAEDDDVTVLNKTELNKLDGFSTTAGILTEADKVQGAADVRLLGNSVSASQFVLADLSKPMESIAVDVTCVSCATATGNAGADPDQLRVVPQKPLRSHTRYAVLWLKGAAPFAGSLPLKMAPAFVLAKSKQPVVVNGKSQVSTVSDEDAVELEKLRLKTQDALAVADARGLSRDDVLLAWTFTTQTTAPTLPALRAKPSEWNLPTGVVGGPAMLTNLPTNLLQVLSLQAGGDFHSAIRWAKEGAFTSGNALDQNGWELDLTNPSAPVHTGTEGPFTPATLATPRQEQLRFWLFVPKVPKNLNGGIPVVIFQHGITGSRVQSALIANSIAKAGYATLAIDLPMHGDRVYCASNSECSNNGACTNHRCPPSASVNDVISGQPSSGLRFGSSTNLAATRDQLRQQIIDVAQLLRVLKDTTNGIGAINVDDSATEGVVEHLDVATPRYIGMSLGALTGSLIVAANPEIPAACLNVGGASPADILTQASVPFLRNRKLKLDAYLKAKRGIDVGTQAYEEFFDIARWMMDSSDAQNMGRYYIDEALTDTLTQTPYPKKRILISWAKDDPWVPNATTLKQINSIESASMLSYFKQHLYDGATTGNHSFMFSIGSAAQVQVTLQSQAEAVSWVDGP